MGHQKYYQELIDGGLSTRDKLYLLSLPEMTEDVLEKYSHRSWSPASLLLARKVANNLVTSQKILEQMLKDKISRFLFGHLIFANPNMSFQTSPINRRERLGLLRNPNLPVEKFKELTSALLKNGDKGLVLPLTERKLPIRGEYTQAESLYRHDVLYYIHTLFIYEGGFKRDKAISAIFNSYFCTAYDVEMLEQISTYLNQFASLSPRNYLLIRKYRRLIARARKLSQE